MTDKATAILLNWRRPHNIPVIVSALCQHKFVGEILVWDNSNTCDNTFNDDRVIVISSSCNTGPYGRFLAMGHAKNEWIITQDDDVVIENMLKLWAARKPDRIVANMFRDEDDSFDGLIRVPKLATASDVWLGYGSVFRRELIGDIFDRYIARWGEDAVLRRDADRVFAVALNRHHHAIQAKVVKFPDIGGPMAIHKDGQEKVTRLARQRGAELAR